MNRNQRLKIEEMIKKKELNKELLIDCIAKINPKIERVNTNIYRAKNYYKDDLNSLVAKDEIKNHKEEFNKWVTYRKPILDLVMQAYKLSLEKVKELIKEANKENLPTFKTIDTIRNMIISYDFKLINGLEQYELAKELKLKKIPFQRINKLNKKQTKKFRDETHTKKVGNKKYKVKAEDGTNFYVSLNRFKKLRSIKKAVNAKGHHLVVFPNFTFSVKDKENNYLKGSQNKGVALNSIQNKYYKK